MRTKVIAILMLLLSTGGCSVKPIYYSDDKKQAEKAIEQYHDAFNRQGYDEIFENSHPDAKATKSKEKLREILSGLYDDLGKVVSSTLTKSDVSPVNGRERKIEMMYRTQFEKGVRTEVFLCITDGTVARLHSFGIATDDELQQLNGR